MIFNVWDLFEGVPGHDCLFGVPPIILLRLLFFQSNLHVRGFSSPRITYKIHSCDCVCAHCNLGRCLQLVSAVSSHDEISTLVLSSTSASWFRRASLHA